MLRSVISRPYVARWDRLHPQARPWTRQTSSSTRGTTPQSFWPYSLRKRLIPYRPWLRQVRLLTPLALAVLLLFHIETTYFFTFAGAYGISMMPTVNSTGDSVIISKLYRRGKGVRIGDLVSFEHPVDQGVQSVKRVIGLEGDWVCRDTPGVGEGTVIQIPKGHCWVVGDNLSWSRDSRLFGPLPVALIKGKVLARYAPWTKFEWIENGLKPAIEDDVD